jgi:transcriptional regulator with XRE-family HTH domain
MKNPAKEIADALNAAMLSYYGEGRKPLSGAELSRLSNVPQPTISRTLQGKSIPETTTLSKLVAVLGAKNVALHDAINALLPKQEAMPANIAALAVKAFPLICPECNKVSHKSFMELEANDNLPCDFCGVIFNINHQYGNGELKMFLESFGGSGMSLRENRKFD